MNRLETIMNILLATVITGAVVSLLMLFCINTKLDRDLADLAETQQELDANEHELHEATHQLSKYNQ